MFIGTLKTYSNVIIFIVLVLLFVCYTLAVYKFGYSNADNKVTSKYEKVISDINAKSAKILQNKIDEYNKFVEKQDKITNDLVTQNEKLSKKLEENQNEASKDSNADKPAIGTSSVMRLNRIR